MFSSVGRRLALLNALVVILVLVTVSIAMLVFLQQRLEAEVDRNLEDRAAAAQVAWTDLFRAQIGAKPGHEVASLLSDDNEDESSDDNSDQESEAGEELIQSGDTIAYALSVDGQILADARGIAIPGLPDLEPLTVAVAGNPVFSETVIDGETVRIYTEPAVVDGVIAGAIQVAQGQGEYEAALQVVRYATLGGLLLGALVAIPAGLFLASRSMRPVRAAFEKQRAFVADASHELRTPLTVLRAQTEYLQRTPDLSAEERENGHQTIIREVDSMSRLVNDLLLLARSDDAPLMLDRRSENATDVARAAIDSFHETADRAGVSLLLNTPERAMISIDRGRVMQVLRIVIDNALNHTPSGGSVTVSVSSLRDAVQFRITDTGSGIAPADLDHVFDRFYRADESRNRREGGAGLGLTIAKTLVDAHGGQIAIESDLENGTTVIVTLPNVQ